MRRQLAAHFGRLVGPERYPPIWRLVRSLIGCRTYDAVADAAMARVLGIWPHPGRLAAASPAQVERALGDVTYAGDKASHLVATLGWIGRECRGFDLSFLKDRPVQDALAWLERFPGVGQKVAASTLNASTLRMRVFIVDSHVHRILKRFGFIGSRADPRGGRDAVTAAAGAFDADGLLELFALLKRLGQTFCRFDRPACHACPLAPRCKAARRQAA
ncbi:MAG TPA: endonuclease III domain-containing protein [Allosphingosinicella sp.]|nr:endonuclease III domain-containing protein [Allosphingosinicella sp.]